MLTRKLLGDCLYLGFKLQGDRLLPVSRQACNTLRKFRIVVMLVCSPRCRRNLVRGREAKIRALPPPPSFERLLRKVLQVPYVAKPMRHLNRKLFFLFYRNTSRFFTESSVVRSLFPAKLLTVIFLCMRAAPRAW